MHFHLSFVALLSVMQLPYLIVLILISHTQAYLIVLTHLLFNLSLDSQDHLNVTAPLLIQDHHRRMTNIDTQQVLLQVLLL